MRLDVFSLWKIHFFFVLLSRSDFFNKIYHYAAKLGLLQCYVRYTKFWCWLGGHTWTSADQRLQGQPVTWPSGTGLCLQCSPDTLCTGLLAAEHLTGPNHITASGVYQSLKAYSVSMPTYGENIFWIWLSNTGLCMYLSAVLVSSSALSRYTIEVSV